MDLGFVSNAVALHDDGVLPGRCWFLLELDSPADGAGPQVAAATVANSEIPAARLHAYFPNAEWAAHGVGQPGYPVLRRALASGAHIRFGFEDSVHLPNGRLATDNVEPDAWAITTASRLGRNPATATLARSIIEARD